MALYPVNLNISGKLCLVVGGGGVALRKIRSLLDCRARVTVISPAVVEEIAALAAAGKIILHPRGYRRGDLAGAFLAFAATDNVEIQEQVASEAAQKGILLNIVDDPARCDFQVPAQVRRGDLLLTVSTGGGSPALARLIREQLEEQFTQGYGTAISLLARVRGVVVDGPGKSEANRMIFQELLRSGVVTLIQEGEWQRVSEILTKLLPPGVDVPALVDDLAVSRIDEGTA